MLFSRNYQRAKRTRVKALLTRSINRSRKSPLTRRTRKSTTKQAALLFDKCRYSHKSHKLVKSTKHQEQLNETGKSSKDVLEDSVDLTGEDKLQCAGASSSLLRTEDLLPNVFQCEPMPEIIKKTIRLSREVTPEPGENSE